MGALSSISGIILTARLNAATVTAGMNMELDAIAASVIGGTSFSGGIGSIPGAILGALIMASLDNGMSLLNMNVSWQYIVKGVVLLVAVLFDVYSKNKE
jgi:D-xylose transport system permease protein